MDLKTYLKSDDLKDVETVKIGCMEGSSFIYCGKFHGESDSAKLKAALKKEGERQHEYYKRRYEKLKFELAQVKRELSHDPFEAMEREVVDAYPSIVEPNQLIINIDGLWNGRFWDIKEYESGKDKEDDSWT